MRKKFFVFSFFIGFLGFCPQLMAQFTSEELAEMAKCEEFLKTAGIVNQEQLMPPAAVTEPWVLILEKDGITKKALWKNPKTRLENEPESWKWEIAAYRLDRYLGLNMVPLTVEKKLKKDRGSCQLWVDSWITLEEIWERKAAIPPHKVDSMNRAFFLQRAFDNLIANEDRHQRNFLITGDCRMILIDHSRSFRTSKDFTTKLIYDENNSDGPMLMKELPRSFVEKLKTLNPRVMKEVAGEYLTEKEIKCVLIRRDLILAWLDKRIKALGEDKVLY